MNEHTLGEPSRRFMRKIEANTEDAISGYLSGAGGPNPKYLDCEKINPTFDIGAGGMLDPRWKQGENAVPFSQQSRFTAWGTFGGSIAGDHDWYAVLIGPDGIEGRNLITGMTNLFSLGSVNPQRTRNQNTVFNGAQWTVNFNAAGALAWNGKFYRQWLTICPIEQLVSAPLQFPGFVVAEMVEEVFTGKTTYTGFHASYVLVPWDCVLVWQLQSMDGTNFPASTVVSLGSFTAFVRPKNTELPKPTW